MRDLIATKGMRYGTRRLQAEDAFSAKSRDARLLVAIGKARYATTDAVAHDASQGDDLTELRATYQEKVGKRAYHGWDADTLRAKIAEA